MPLMSERLSETVESEDTFRILVATDIHLGYAEKDAIKGDDTFRTFEEVLQIADNKKVDFILLGGDLFHETKPSPYCVYKCTELLRKYCLGNRQVEIEFLSEQERHFQHTTKQIVNYEDPDLNISIPVFSIHGNHDDPTGNRHISAMDLMASTGLVNYFGKWTELTHVDIEPILLRKGESHLALYGLSHIKDERLGRLFLEQKVSITEPPNNVAWFDLLVWHQNRVARGAKNFIPESSIPDFIDLVIWGHEHDCVIKPESSMNGVPISQPGSTVATSLTEGESGSKQICLLEIKEKNFYLQPIELKTVRPFVYKTLQLDPVNVMRDGDASHPTHRAMNQVADEIDLMIEEANGFERSFPMLPLIRLKVFYHDERQVFNNIRFGQSYVGRVANPADIVMFAAVRKTEPKRKKGTSASDSSEDVDDASAYADRVEDIVLRSYENAAKKMVALSVKGLNEAVTKYITSADSEAPVYLMDSQMKNILNQFRKIKPDIDSVQTCLEKLRDEREQGNKDIEEARQILNDSNRPTTGNLAEMEVTVIDSDDDVDTSVSMAAPPARGRGSRGGRGTRRPRRSRAKGLA